MYTFHSQLRAGRLGLGLDWVLDLLNHARLDVVHVPRNGHVQDQGALPKERDIVQHALPQIREGQKRHVVNVLFELLPDLGPELMVGEALHATAGLCVGSVGLAC